MGVVALVLLGLLNFFMGAWNMTDIGGPANPGLAMLSFVSGAACLFVAGATR